jgi:hypothetical protein
MSQVIFTFENGWSASLVDHGYGHEEGLMEIGVLGPSGRLAYGAIASTGTDAVVGHLDQEDDVHEAFDGNAVNPDAPVAGIGEMLDSLVDLMERGTR